MGAPAMKGMLLIAGGVLVALAGVAWGLDIRGITSGFYEFTIRSWAKIPVVGEDWIRKTSYRRFRMQAFIPWTVFGILMIAIGIHLVAG